MPASPRAARSYDKKPYAGGGKPYAGKRDGAPPRRDRDDAPRARGDRPFGDRPPRFNRDDRAAAAKSAPIRRAAIARISTATTAHRARDARPAARFQDRKFGDKKPYTPREGGGEKRPYTPRGEGFRKDGDRPRGRSPVFGAPAARWRSSAR